MTLYKGRKQWYIYSVIAILIRNSNRIFPFSCNKYARNCTRVFLERWEMFINHCARFACLNYTDYNSSIFSTFCFSRVLTSFTRMGSRSSTRQEHIPSLLKLRNTNRRERIHSVRDCFRNVVPSVFSIFFF